MVLKILFVCLICLFDKRKNTLSKFAKKRIVLRFTMRSP
jgi:hypothetical protein